MCLFLCGAVYTDVQQVPFNDNGEDLLDRGFLYGAGLSPTFLSLDKCLF